MSQRDRLPTVLVGSDLRDDLRSNIAGCRETMRPLDQSSADDCAVLQHIFQIDQIAVVHMLSEVVGVMEVDDALFVGVHYVGGQQKPLAQIAGDLASHVVPLRGVDDGIFVGVLLLGLLVAALDQTQNFIVRRIAAANQRAGITIGDVILRHLKGPARGPQRPAARRSDQFRPQARPGGQVRLR